MKSEDKECLKQFWQREQLLLISTIVTGGISLAVNQRVQNIGLHNLLAQKPVVIQVSQNCAEKFTEDKKYSIRELDVALKKLEMKGSLKAASTLSKSIEKCGTTEFSAALKKQKKAITDLKSESLLLLHIININLVLLSILFSYTLLRNPYFLGWSGHLLLPEEMIAELIALKRRRQKQNVPQWKLNLELTTEVLFLLWAIHIEIRLQNLSLPPSKKRNIE